MVTNIYMMNVNICNRTKRLIVKIRMQISDLHIVLENSFYLKKVDQVALLYSETSFVFFFSNLVFIFGFQHVHKRKVLYLSHVSLSLEIYPSLQIIVLSFLLMYKRYTMLCMTTNLNYPEGNSNRSI